MSLGINVCIAKWNVFVLRGMVVVDLAVTERRCGPGWWLAVAKSDSTVIRGGLLAVAKIDSTVIRGGLLAVAKSDSTVIREVFWLWQRLTVP